jgi:hypothetical protein
MGRGSSTKWGIVLGKPEAYMVVSAFRYIRAMKKILLARLLAVGVSAPAWGQIPGRINALRRPGETRLFSFETANGKTAVLCEGAKKAHLVYRFGTAAKVELQYPIILTASS